MTGSQLSEYSSATCEARTLSCAHRISLAHDLFQPAPESTQGGALPYARSVTPQPQQPQQHQHGKPMTEQPKNRFTQKSLRLFGFDRLFDVLALASTAAKARVDALALRADRAG